jgi:hypothetical protein
MYVLAGSSGTPCLRVATHSLEPGDMYKSVFVYNLNGAVAAAPLATKSPGPLVH